MLKAKPQRRERVMVELEPELRDSLAQWPQQEDRRSAI
jgi:hypothetical protein